MCLWKMALFEKIARAETKWNATKEFFTDNFDAQMCSTIALNRYLSGKSNIYDGKMKIVTSY